MDLTLTQKETGRTGDAGWNFAAFCDHSPNVAIHAIPDPKDGQCFVAAGLFRAEARLAPLKSTPYWRPASPP
jgi:hypothetical protein